MIIGIFVILLAVLACRLYYTKVYLVKKKIELLKKTFEDSGYKVKVEPFMVFGSPGMEHMIRSEKEHGSPMYYRQHGLIGYDVVLSTIFGSPMVHLINLDLLQSFFNTELATYVKHEPFTFNFRRLFGRSMGLVEGEQWRMKRKVISVAFHFDFLQSIIPVICRTVDESFADFEKEHPEKQKKMDIIEMFQVILSSIMVSAFFGSNCKGRTLEGKKLSTYISDLVADGSRQSQSLPAMLLGPKFSELGIRAVDRDINRRSKLFKAFAGDLVGNIVNELKEKNFKVGDKKNGNLVEELYLAKLKSAQKGSDEDVFGFVDIIHEFIGFFFAGTDTTSHLTTMMMMYIEKHPEVKKRVIEEIDSVIRSDADINDDNLSKMKYLQAVRLETHRLYGPGLGILPRRAVVDHKIGTVQIPQDTLVGVELAANNFNPAYYKEPDEFRPERWLNDELTKVHPFMFIPFSSGKRNCIGQHLAKLESKIMVIKFIKRYDFRVEGIQNLRLKRKFLVQPQNPFVEITVRSTEMAQKSEELVS